MGHLVFTVQQKFRTKGVWAAKGRKNLVLPAKDAALKVKECGSDLKLLFQHIDIEDGLSRLSFNIGKEGLDSGGILKIDYDTNEESFMVEVDGVLRLEVEDTFIEQFTSEGDKLKFVLIGVIAKEGPFFGGYISRYEKFDRDLHNYSDCPSVKTNIIK